ETPAERVDERGPLLRELIAAGCPGDAKLIADALHVAKLSPARDAPAVLLLPAELLAERAPAAAHAHRVKVPARLRGRGAELLLQALEGEAPPGVTKDCDRPGEDADRQKHAEPAGKAGEHGPAPGGESAVEGPGQRKDSRHVGHECRGGPDRVANGEG